MDDSCRLQAHLIRADQFGHGRSEFSILTGDLKAAGRPRTGAFNRGTANAQSATHIGKTNQK